MCEQLVTGTQYESGFFGQAGKTGKIIQKLSNLKP